MSAIEPTEKNLREWLDAVARPESPVARQMAMSLIIGAFTQVETANAVLAREVVALRAINDANADLLKRSLEVLSEVFPQREKPRLSLVKPEGA